MKPTAWTLKEYRRRFLLFLFLSLLILFLSPAFVLGAETGEEQNQMTQIEEEALWEASGAEELFDLLPEETRDFLSQNQINGVDSDAILNLKPETFFSMVWDGVVSKATMPLKILASAVGIILLSALLGVFEEQFEDKSFCGVFHVVSILCISGILISPVIEVIQSSMKLIGKVSDFLLGFIPVYAGIVSVSGKPLSAFASQGMLLGMVELMSYLSTSFLIPLCGIYLALTLTGAATDQIQVNAVAKGIRTVLLWVMGFLLTLFVGLLTVKSFVADSADTVTLRAGKYLAGSFLPMIGGAISDSLSVLHSSLGVMRSTVGAFGILAVLVCFLPGIISILLMNLSLGIARIVSDILEVKRVSGLLEAAGFVLNLLQSVLICYGLMVVISIALMMVLGKGG